MTIKLSKQAINLLGKKFGKWSVLSVSHKDKAGLWYWNCVCACGTIRKVSGNSLRRKEGSSKSCGCNREPQRQSSITHNMSKTIFYKVWLGMKKRCSTTKGVVFKNYLSRGIKVCERWMNFENFRDDMYESYLEHKKQNKRTTLDRINNDGGYYKENCKWSTYDEQSNNRRGLIKIKLPKSNEVMTIAELSKRINVSKGTLRKRFFNPNYTGKRDITEPLCRKNLNTE